MLQCFLLKNYDFGILLVFRINPFMTEADLLRKSMDWFLYDIGLRHEKVKCLLSLYKTPKLHLVSWCGNFVETYSFRRVSMKTRKTLRKLCASTKLSHHEIRLNYGNLSSAYYGNTECRKSLKSHSHFLPKNRKNHQKLPSDCFFRTFTGVTDLLVICYSTSLLLQLIATFKQH